MSVARKATIPGFNEHVQTLRALEGTGRRTFTFAGAGTAWQAASINIDVTNVVTVRHGAGGVSAAFDRVSARGLDLSTIS